MKINLSKLSTNLQAKIKKELAALEKNGSVVKLLQKEQPLFAVYGPNHNIFITPTQWEQIKGLKKEYETYDLLNPKGEAWEVMYIPSENVYVFSIPGTDTEVVADKAQFTKTESRDFKMDILTVPEQELEKELTKFLDSVIKNVTISEKQVPIRSYEIGEVKERDGKFTVIVLVTKDGYVPTRFVPGILKDVKKLLEDWAEENSTEIIDFRVYAN